MRTLFLLRRLLQHAGSELAVAQTADPAAALCSQNLRFSADSLPCISFFVHSSPEMFPVYIRNLYEIIYSEAAGKSGRVYFSNNDKDYFTAADIGELWYDYDYEIEKAAERSGHSTTEFIVALYKKTTDRFTFPVNQMIKENRAELHGYCRISADFASIAYGENQLSERQRVLIFVIQ